MEQDDDEGQWAPWDTWLQRNVEARREEHAAEDIRRAERRKRVR